MAIGVLAKVPGQGVGVANTIPSLMVVKYKDSGNIQVFPRTETTYG